MENKTASMEHIDYKIEVQYSSAGPIAATASDDGKFVMVDFANHLNHSKALRLAFPASQLENFVAAMLHVQKAIADPTSGIHHKQPH